MLSADLVLVSSPCSELRFCACSVVTAIPDWSAAEADEFAIGEDETYVHSFYWDVCQSLTLTRDVAAYIQSASGTVLALNR